jgi:hypothetical protein
MSAVFYWKVPLYNVIMKQSLERFIIGIPYPLLRKVLYLYIGAVVFWDVAPIASLLLWVVILATLLLIGYQSNIRKSYMAGRNPSDRMLYMETMRSPVRYWVPRLILIVAAGALTGYLLDGQYELGGIQIFFLTTGYALFYRETNLLGAYVAYLVTGRGIGMEYIAGHSVYHTFIEFDEIRSINIIRDQSPSPTWSLLTPLSREKSGLLLIPADPNGFTSNDHSFFITPKNVRSFLSHLPDTVKVIDAD